MRNDAARRPVFLKLYILISKTPRYALKMTKAIVFDLDDTLIPSEQIYKEVLEELELNRPESGYNLARADVKKVLERGNPASHNRVLYFKRLLELQNQFSASDCFSLVDRYELKLTETLRRRWNLLNRTPLFLELRRKSKLYILTNENLRTQLLKLNVIDPTGEIFTGMICSEEAGLEKPHLGIFKLLQSRYLEKEKFDEVIMVGDDPVADLTPAQALGWLPIQTYEFINKKVDGHSFQRVSSLSEVLKWID